jgi:FixJ family two-component response regulator
VAIVDDDESVRKALARLLACAGIRSETFESAEPFLDSLVRGRPDCVLVDICMPGMDGIELLQRMKEMSVNVPAILITAHDDDRTHQAHLASGAAGLLLKPVDDEVLLQAIRAATA